MQSYVTKEQLLRWSEASRRKWANLIADNPDHKLDLVPNRDAVFCTLCRAEVSGEEVALADGHVKLPACSGAI